MIRRHTQRMPPNERCGQPVEQNQAERVVNLYELGIYCLSRCLLTLLMSLKGKQCKANSG